MGFALVWRLNARDIFAANGETSRWQSVNSDPGRMGSQRWRSSEFCMNWSSQSGAYWQNRLLTWWNSGHSMPGMVHLCCRVCSESPVIQDLADSRVGCGGDKSRGRPPFANQGHPTQSDGFVCREHSFARSRGLLFARSRHHPGQDLAGHGILHCIVRWWCLAGIWCFASPNWQGPQNAEPNCDVVD
jgi:hypothetical protein